MIIIVDDTGLDDTGHALIESFLNKKRLILLDFSVDTGRDDLGNIKQEITLTLQNTNETITKEELFAELL